MSKLEFPYYEWRYLPKPECVHGENAAWFLSSTLVLMLITEREDHIVIDLDNPRPSITPEEQPALSTERLNNLLHSSLEESGGIFKALAAQTLFVQQARMATANRQSTLLDTTPQIFRDSVIRELLAPSLGWMVWTWQLETLLRSAGCTTPMSRELVLCWRMNYPRTSRLLETLRIGGLSVRQIVNKTTCWGWSFENMTFTPGLLDCFQSRVSITHQDQQSQHSKLPKGTLPMTNPSTSFGESLARRFIHHFIECWNEFIAMPHPDGRPDQILPKKKWTQWMNGSRQTSEGEYGILRKTLEALRDDKTLDQALCTTSLVSDQVRLEDNRFDLALVGGSPLLRHGHWGHPSRFYALVEHEQGDDPESELWKLLFWRADLKVIVLYDWTDEYLEKDKNKLWLEKKIALFKETIKTFNSDQGNEDSSFYLLLIGNRRNNSSGITRWRFRQLTELGETPFENDWKDASLDLPEGKTIATHHADLI